MKRYKKFFEKALTPTEALQVFGLEKVPDKETLKGFYKDLSRKFHPDLGGDV